MSLGCVVQSPPTERIRIGVKAAWTLRARPEKPPEGKLSLSKQARSAQALRASSFGGGQVGRLQTLKPRLQLERQAMRLAPPPTCADMRERGRPWRRAREKALTRDYGLCVLCSEAGLITTATEVDHITPISQGGAQLEQSNLRSLCHACHQSVRAQQGL